MKRTTRIAFSALAALAVAVAITTAPATAGTQYVSVLKHEFDVGSALRFEPPYVAVNTTLQLDRPGRCPWPGLVMELWRQTGDQPGPGDLIWQGTGYSAPLFKQYLALNTRYRYHASARCPAEPVGGVDFTPMVSDGVAFGIRLQDDLSSGWPSWPFYNGMWSTLYGPGYIGGTAHDARQSGASATIQYAGVAAAWVTTRDYKPAWDQDPARVACDYQLCNSFTTALPSATYTGLAQFRRVMSAGWLSNWGSSSTNSPHRLQVIADDSDGVDVDAFLIVEDCEYTFAVAC